MAEKAPLQAFRRVLDAIGDGVYVTTADREIVFWSAGAERITGYRPDEVVGKHCYDDILGHQAGDDALRFVASVLAANARKMDLAVRYGGDEFVVLCAVPDAEDLTGYGMRLVNLIRESRLAPLQAAGLSLSVSAGGALVRDDDPDELAAVARADAAMYAAKHAGGDGYRDSTP